MVVPAVYDRVRLSNNEAAHGTMVSLQANGTAIVIWDHPEIDKTCQHTDLEIISRPRSVPPAEIRLLWPAYTPHPDDSLLGLYDDGIVRIKTHDNRIINLELVLD